MIRPALLLACAAALGACGRPLVDVPGPRLEVLAPDLDETLSTPVATFRLRAAGADRLVLGQDTLLPDEAGTFERRRALTFGLNRVPVAVLGPARPGRAADVLARDTLDALVLPLAPTPMTPLALPVARAQAAAAVFAGGRVAETGGFGISSEALATATLIDVQGTTLVPTLVALPEPRGGHTASPVAGPGGSDGILLLGGATDRAPTGSASLVGRPRLLLASGEVRDLNGPDVLRMGHAARVLVREGRTFVHLVGGLVPTGGGAGGTALAPTGALEILEWIPAETRLERLTPPGGAGAFVPIARPLLLPLATGPDAARDALFGPESGVRLVYRAPGSRFPFDVSARAATPLPEPRSGAAGAPLGEGLGLVLGGRSPGGQVVRPLLAVADGSARIFRLPPNVELAVPRSDAAAVRLRDGRVLVLGGRTVGGGTTAAVEAFRL